MSSEPFPTFFDFHQWMPLYLASTQSKSGFYLDVSIMLLVIILVYLLIPKGGDDAALKLRIQELEKQLKKDTNVQIVHTHSNKCLTNDSF